MAPPGGFGVRLALPLVIGPALNSINTTMIAVALVPIARAMGTTAAQTILLVACLYLAAAVAQPAMGRLVDLYGPRRVYVTGMAVAAVAGLVPLVLPTFGGALAARIAIGVGTSGAYPAAMAAIRVGATQLRREPPRALFSALSVSSLTSAAIGPVLGGILVEHFGWQAIFVVNAPYAVVALVLALLWLPAGRPTATGDGPGQESLDLPGLVLFTVTIGAALVVVLGLWPGQYWLLLVAAATGTALVLWERRRPHPFLDVRMLAANPALLRTFARLFLVYTCTYLVIYGVTQWLQSAAGYAADAAGWMQLPAVVLAGLAAAVVSRSRGLRAPLIVAAALPVVGGVLLTVVVALATAALLLTATDRALGRDDRLR